MIKLKNIKYLFNKNHISITEEPIKVRIAPTIYFKNIYKNCYERGEVFTINGLRLTPLMYEMAGKEAIITGKELLSVYRIDLDNGRFSWGRDMFDSKIRFHE